MAARKSGGRGGEEVRDKILACLRDVAVLLIVGRRQGFHKN